MSYLRSRTGLLITGSDALLVLALLTSQLNVAFAIGVLSIVAVGVFSIVYRQFCERGDDLKMFAVSVLLYFVALATLFALTDSSLAALQIGMSAALFWSLRLALIRLLFYVRKYGAF